MRAEKHALFPVQQPKDGGGYCLYLIVRIAYGSEDII